MMCRRLVAAFFAAMTLSACAPSHHVDAPVRRRTFGLTPMEYALEDKACGADNAADSFGPQSVSLWDGSTLSTTVRGFASLSSTGGSLHGAQIDGVLYGLAQREERHCQASGHHGLSCDKSQDQTFVVPPSPLPLCRATGTYSRDSAESVALSTVGTLEDAAQFYVQVPGANAVILPTSLLLLPRLETIEYVSGAPEGPLDVDLIETDNAAWTLMRDQNGGVKPAFFVLPSSKEVLESPTFSGANLWEIPFVMTHEFGHHVFFTHAKNIAAYFLKDAAGTDGVVAMTAETQNILRRQTLASELRRTAARLESAGSAQLDGAAVSALAASTPLGHFDSARTTLTAVNEGIADLYAYYATGSKPAQLHGLPCFAATRDVDSAVFASGRQKVLDSEVLDTLSAGNEVALQPDEDCRNEHFDDPHATGAIIAHALERLIAGSDGEAVTSAQHATKLIAFIEAFDANWAKLTTPTASNILTAASRAMLATTKAAGTPLSAEACKTVRALLPAVTGLDTQGEFACPTAP